MVDHSEIFAQTFHDHAEPKIEHLSRRKCVLVIVTRITAGTHFSR